MADMQKHVSYLPFILLFLFFGGVWVGLAHLLPPGTLRDVGVVALAVVFAALFLVLLLQHVRAILAGTEHLVVHSLLAAAQLALSLSGFAAVHQVIGLHDNLHPGGDLVHAFDVSLYYSVVTFTTLGYGDFYPVGPGRVLAGIQSLTGYIVLALLASTLTTAISPHSRAGWRNRDEDQEES